MYIVMSHGDIFVFLNKRILKLTFTIPNVLILFGK